jgi:hypothetical protein
LGRLAAAGREGLHIDRHNCAQIKLAKVGGLAIRGRDLVNLVRNLGQKIGRDDAAKSLLGQQAAQLRGTKADGSSIGRQA